MNRRRILCLLLCALPGLRQPLVQAQAVAGRAMLLLALFLAHSSGALAQPTVTVFAAASLSGVLNTVGSQYRDKTGTLIRFSFAASSALARQIDQGAQADLFASADEEWMDWLAARQRVVAGSRRSLLGNRLVLVAPAGSGRKVEIGPALDFIKLIGSGRWVTGDPAHVPVGRYAREALTHFGWWREAEPRLARAENVRAALVLVERGEAPLGIVYETDARATTRVDVIGVFPPASHQRISYPFAIIAGRDRAEVRGFLEHIAGPGARAVFVAAGFTLP